MTTLLQFWSAHAAETALLGYRRDDVSAAVAEIVAQFSGEG